MTDEQERLQGDEDGDDDLEELEPPLPRHVDHEREVVLHDADLVVERPVALVDLEGGAELAVQAVERLVLPRDPR